MLNRVLVCLLFAAVAWAQTANSNSAQAPAAQSSAQGMSKEKDSKDMQDKDKDMDEKPAAEAAKPEVPADAAVITLMGICDGDAKSPDCKTVITRAEFEKLLSAVAPAGGSVNPMARKQLATRYAMGLVMSKEAEKQGLDKGPKYEEMMKLARIQVLSQELGQSLQQQAGQVPDKEVDDYYEKNKTTFDEVQAQRLFIPHSRSLPAPKTKLTDAENKKRQADAEAAMKVEADALQKRAVAGESFAKLQKEAFTFAGFKSEPASTDLGKIRRNSLPPDHHFIMELKSGEVSKLIADSTGYFVYKVGEKDTLAEDKVKDEIHNILRAQRLQESMGSLQKSATPDLNESYFGPPEKPEEEPDGKAMPKPPTGPK